MLCGEPIWQTSSTGPMSMPSSSDAVATSARSSPARRRCSTRWRRSRDSDPWCAATWSSPSRSPSSWATRSDSFLVLTNTRVVRWRATWRGDAVEDLVELIARDRRLELAVG